MKAYFPDSTQSEQLYVLTDRQISVCYDNSRFGTPATVAEMTKWAHEGNEALARLERLAAGLRAKTA